MFLDQPPGCSPFDPSPKPSNIVGYNIHDRVFLSPNSSASYLSLAFIALILLMIVAWSESQDTPMIFASSHWDDASLIWPTLDPSVSKDNIGLFCMPCCDVPLSMDE